MTKFHGPNVVSCEVITNGKRTLLIFTLLPHFTQENVRAFEDSLTCFWYQYSIVLGDLNTNILQAQNPHIQQVAELLMDFGLMDLLHHFRK